MPNKTLILGAGGVFGNHEAKYRLANSDETIYCVGRNPRLGKEFNLGVGDADSRYEYHQVHMVFEIDRIKELITKEKINVVINYAALAYANSWDKGHYYFRTNTTFVAELCDFLQHLDFFDFFLQIGSSEVYGGTPAPATEADINPTSPYSVSKLAADLYLMSMASVRKFPCSIIRPSNCFGEGQYVYRILPKLILSVLNRQKFPLQGGGTAQKSFMHVENLCKANDLILTNRPIGEVFNCGPKDAISMASLAKKTIEMMGEDFEACIEISAGREFEDDIYWLDSSKIEEQLDWELSVSLENGLERMISWVAQNKDELTRAASVFELRA